MIRIVPALAFVGALLLSASEISLAQPAPADIVKQRQDGMENMWKEYLKDVAASIKSEKPDLNLIATKAAGASALQKKLATLFPPGTGRDVVPKTRAKPEVWSQRSEFEGNLKALNDETEALAAAAKAGDVDKVKAEWPKLAKACGGCHGGPVKSGGKFRFEEE